MSQLLTVAPAPSARSARVKKATERSNTQWMNWLLAPVWIGAKLARMCARSVQPAVERTRVAENLDASWSVTYAADHGKDVLIRFDREPETPDWQMLAVRVNKATGVITVLKKAALPQRVSAG
jgi:hypothetical protein